MNSNRSAARFQQIYIYIKVSPACNGSTHSAKRENGITNGFAVSPFCFVQHWNTAGSTVHKSLLILLYFTDRTTVIL